jgi:hypothetical protein
MGALPVNEEEQVKEIWYAISLYLRRVTVMKVKRNAGCTKISRLPLRKVHYNALSSFSTTRSLGETSWDGHTNRMDTQSDEWANVCFYIHLPAVGAFQVTTSRKSPSLPLRNGGLLATGWGVREDFSSPTRCSVHCVHQVAEASGYVCEKAAQVSWTSWRQWYFHDVTVAMLPANCIELPMDGWEPWESVRHSISKTD